MDELTWVEISRSALENNIREFRRLIGPKTLLCPCVKANAYGHGLLEATRAFLAAGADWLSVNSLYEARALRSSGIDSPIYILGSVPPEGIQEALELDCRLVVFCKDQIRSIARAAKAAGRSARVHLKVETGSNRMGVRPESIVDFACFIQKQGLLEIEGLATHFANIEDTTDHGFAELQLRRFNEASDLLRSAGISVPIRHCANSAAAILLPRTHFDMVRPGIAAYGMWPSNETYVSFVKERKNRFLLTPAFTWKTRIAQVKTVPSGEFVGYGCTYKTSHTTRLAILPIGYYDGYDRGITGGHVLIRGKRAAIRGRICMNVLMVEVTDIPGVKPGDEAVLIGRSCDEFISAELFAQWAATINYEVTTRVNDRIPRISGRF